jgi:predicted lipid-binding transport protein (Tim44 family)
MFRQRPSPVPRSSAALVMDRRKGTVYARHVLRFLFIVALLGTWFMPLIIAALYKLPHQRPIAVLSLLLGWTGAGWLAALVIAVGGAIRATRPAVAGQGQPQDQGAGESYVATQPYPPAQPAWPAAAPASPFLAGAQPSQRAQSPERSQPQELSQPSAPPSWPDNPH